MKVKKIMSTNLVSIRPDDTIKKIVKVFSENKIGGAPVIDEEENLVGIVTDADVFKKMHVRYKEFRMAMPSAQGFTTIDFRSRVRYKEIKKAFKAIAKIKAKEIMVKKVKIISPDDQVEEVVPIVVEKKVNRLPVVKDGKVVGIVSRGDILRALLMK